MKRTFYTLVFLLVISCSSKSQGKNYLVKEKLPKTLNEISGVISVGNDIWAISDKPSPVFFRLNQKGKVQQEVRFKKLSVMDVEAITADDQYLYIGDVGDNTGDRKMRKIIRVALGSIGKGEKTEVAGDVINFSFADDVLVEKKKKNDFDCEAVLSFNDSLYLFTKRRTDDRSELYVLSKKPGTQVARLVSIYDTHGLVTDAAVNKSKNEVVLIGYDKGHENPFMLFFSNFKGNDFFSGKAERVELKNKKEEWQVEGITFKSDDEIYFSCEKTKDVDATLYAVIREQLVKSKK